MKRFLIVALALVAVTPLVAIDSVEAARMGGGRSLGVQRPAAPPAARAPSVAPASPVAPAQALPPKAAPAATGASRWLGPLAGLAAGIGLAALLSHFGLSEGFADILMLALLVFGAIFLIRMLLRRREPANVPTQYAGAAVAQGPVYEGTPNPFSQSAPVTTSQFEPVFGGTPGATQPPPAGKFPAGFDPVPFVQQATMQFRKLQAAYDAGDRKALADVLTPELFSEIDKEIAERGAHAPTKVDALDAVLLEVTTEGDRHWASVHFTGMLREDGMVLPKPFDEIWNLVKPVGGKSGWLLAGIRQLA